MEQTGQIVLLVDDDPVLLRGIEVILRRGGYSPIAASGSVEALKQSRGFSDKIHLLLTDVAMPEMNGLTLAERILAERMQIRVLLRSGLASVRSRLPLVQKPFRRDELLERVANVIDSPPPLPSDIFTNRKPSRDNAVAALERELNAARRRYLEASRDFLQVSGDVPSGIPSPDGVLRLQLQANERQRAFEEYQSARKKLASQIASTEV